MSATRVKELPARANLLEGAEGDKAPRQVTMIIGGKESPGEGVGFEIRNPANPSHVVAIGNAATAQQLDEATAAASMASANWGQMSVVERGAVLRRAAEAIARRAPEFAQLLTLEEGKTLKDSSIEVARAIETLHFYAAVGRLSHGETLPSSQPGQFIFTKREPIGVVALITPWNFPLAIPVQKLAPALVQGNAVLLKPSSYTPAIAFELCKVLVDSGLPPGVLNLLIGPGGELGSRIAADPAIGAISFTGSETVGRELSLKSSTRPVRLQLELGGKNPLLVMDDADFDRAVEVAAIGTFGLTGQSCTATGRILAHSAIYDRFVDELTMRADSLVIGDGLAEGVQMGPKVSEAELRIVTERITRSASDGTAEVVTGGERQESRNGGHFMAPAVLSHVTLESDVGRSELFSPVACITPFETFDEGLALANDTPYGLSAAICTQDLRLAHHFVNQIDSGIVKVNASTTGLELHVPFGGLKHSSNGTAKELGIEALDFYSRAKSVFMTYGN